MSQFTLVFEPAEEGGYSASVAVVPGANSQGEKLEEAKAMVIEALVELLEYRRDKAKALKDGVLLEQIALS